MLIFSLGLLLMAAIAAALLEELVSVDVEEETASLNFAGNFERGTIEEVELRSAGGNNLELAGSGFGSLLEVPGISGMLCKARALLSMLEVGWVGREENGALVEWLAVMLLESVLE